MKKNKYIFVLIMLLVIALAGGIFTTAYVKFSEKEEKKEAIQVVTSFYPVYVAAENVVGDNPGINLKNLSEPQTGCMHDYQLTPQDMILLSEADVFIVNGGGIENFLSEVAEAYPELTIIQATEGLALLQEKGAAHIQEEEQVYGGENAHAWMNTELYAEMVQNIADGLSEADKEHEAVYQENAGQYCKKVQKLTEQMEALKGELAGKNTIIFHAAYAYTAEQLGMQVSYCMDLDEERQVSAGEVAEVLEEIENHQVSVILAEERYGKAMGDMIEKEGECRVYYLDSLVRGSYEKDSYLHAMQKNIDLLWEIAGKE